MDNDTADDPMSSSKWSRKSIRKINEDLASQGIILSPPTTSKILKGQKYSLKANRKTIAETQHPDRNRQFEIIAGQKKKFADMGQPLTSIDSKKKELVGNYNLNLAPQTPSPSAAKIFQNHPSKIPFDLFNEKF